MRRASSRRTIRCAVLSCTVLGACARRAESARPTAAVRTEPHAAGASALQLSEESARRLDLQTSVATEDRHTTVRTFVGEVVAPPGRVFTLAAPVSGTVRAHGGAEGLYGGVTLEAQQPVFHLRPFAPTDRDLRAQAARLVALAQARAEVTRLRVRRGETLLHEQAGSERALEEARGELAIAEAELRAARTREQQLRRDPLGADVELTIRAPGATVLRALFVADGQAVAAGAPLAELLDRSMRWVRVPVPVAEDALFATASAVRAQIDGERAAVELRAIDGLPTADFAAGTRDRWFALREPVSWAPGLRVAVRVLREGPARVRVPLEALLFDATGGAVLFVAHGAQRYARQRVLVGDIDERGATLTAGLDPGTSVVTRGAVELFGLDAPGGH